MPLGSAVKTVVVLASLVMIVAGLKLSAPFFLPVLAAAFLAVISSPVVRLLHRRARLPRPLAVMLTLLLNMALLGGFGALLATSFSGLELALPRYQIAFRSFADTTAVRLRGWGLHVADDAVDQLLGGDTMMGMFGQAFAQLTELVSNTILVVLMLGFLLFELAEMRDKLGLLLGRASPHLDRLARGTLELQRYLVVKTVLSVLTGALTGAWLAACGVDFPLLWGLLTFLLNYIPSIGPAIALGPPLVIALLTMGIGDAALVAAGTLSIGFVIGNLLEPKMMGQALGLSTLVVFLSMLFWGWLWGPVGALFAVPLTMILRSALEVGESTRWMAVMLGNAEYVEQKVALWRWGRTTPAELPRPPQP